MVFIGPKQIVNSSGTTWAIETHGFHCEFPNSFEVKIDAPVSNKNRCFTSAIHGDIYLFRDMSEKGDIDKVTNSSSYRYKEYEEKCLNHL